MSDLKINPNRDRKNRQTLTLGSDLKSSKFKFLRQSLFGQYFKRYLDFNFIDRLPSLRNVGFFLISYLVLVFLVGVFLLIQVQSLQPYYRQLQGVEGGVYVEGMVGRISNFNPLYAQTEVDLTVSNLLFAGLLKYDSNNRLQPNLAASIKHDANARQYTVVLKDDLRWHDGQPLTADDVVFTFEVLQSSKAKSPLRINWEGVSVDKIDQLTVRFTLSNPYSPFASNLTIGILPRHLLISQGLDKLQDANFNLNPVGNGPLKFKEIVVLNQAGEYLIKFERNHHYQGLIQTSSPTKLDELQLFVVPSFERLHELFNQGQLSGAYNLNETQIDLNKYDYQVTDFDLMSVVYLFFNNSKGLTKNPQARQALAYALQRPQLVRNLSHGNSRVKGPLLSQHLGYKTDLRVVNYNLDRARSLLMDLGYSFDGQAWYKDGEILKLTITTQAGSTYEQVATEIKRQLEQNLKIKIDIDLRSRDDFPSQVLRNHQYEDMLVYGLDLGADADVYSYWHSSQIGSHSILRLNLSLYDSMAVDDLLQVARETTDLSIRGNNYRNFQTLWQQDLPALPLYRLQLNYYTFGNVQGPSPRSFLIKAYDRFDDVQHWTVLTESKPY